MKYIFSQHALDQIKKRNIHKDIIEHILLKPDKIIEEPNYTIYQAIIEEKRTGKNYLYRIFVNTRKQPNLVITVYKTSKIDKYHED